MEMEIYKLLSGILISCVCNC